MLAVGIDLHRRRSDVVALNEAGEVVLKRRMASSREGFSRVFGEMEDEPFEVVFEATYGWMWVADLLADAGIPHHMAHPLATKAITAARVKNDSVDATTLAHLLRTHLLPEAWIAPQGARDLRRLVRSRAALMRMRSRLKCQIHAVLADHGILPEYADLFGGAGRRYLEQLDLPSVAQHRVEALLRVIDAFSSEILTVDRELRSAVSGDDRVRRLLAIPGVGPYTAATVVAEVWDVHRFHGPEQLACWAGLTPRERSSADHVRRGHISKQGSRWLRWVLVEASIRACKDQKLRAFYEGIARRRGWKIARVALARRLLTICYYALRDSDGSREYPASVVARS